MSTQEYQTNFSYINTAKRGQPLPPTSIESQINKQVLYIRYICIGKERTVLVKSCFYTSITMCYIPWSLYQSITILVN